MLGVYYRLTKPGIIYGNALTAAAGFLLASHWQINGWLMLATIVGTSLVMASACVFNNYLDRGIDAVMERTKQRALPQHQVSAHSAIIYASTLGVVGFAILVAWTNWLVVGIGLVAIVTYVVLYGWAKRHSIHGTLVGSIAGAAPPLAGYVAASGHFDLAAWVVFATMTIWQMPHFYAIAIYRLKDYKSAKLPVLSVAKGVEHTRKQIMVYISAFTIASVTLTPLGITGWTYAVVMIATGLGWQLYGARSWHAKDTALWARRMFFASLIVILIQSTAWAVGPLLP